MDGSDPKRDPRIATHATNRISATHSTNRISTQKLLSNPTIQVVVGPITSLVTAGVLGAREIFNPQLMVLPHANVTDAARPCAYIYHNTGKVIGTERDSATPREASSSDTRSISIFENPKFVAISFSAETFRDQDIVNPRLPVSIVKRDRSAEPFDTLINGNPAKNSGYTSFFSHVVGMEAVSREVSDVDVIKRMNFASNPALRKNPKFVDLQISTVNTLEKSIPYLPLLPDRKG